MDDLLNRLEKSAAFGTGLIKGVGNYLKNVSGHNVGKLLKEQKVTDMNSNRWTQLPQEIQHAKVDRNIARAGTAAVGMAAGAGLGGYKAYEQSKQEPMDTDLYQQNQFTQNYLQPKIASELIERLEKTASEQDNELHYSHHDRGSAEGAAATAGIGTLLGGLSSLKRGGESGALKGGLGVLRGAAIGTVLGAIPGMEVGGAIGSLGDFHDMEKTKRMQEREAYKEEIKEELRQQMGKSANDELLGRLEKTAGFGLGKDLWRATGIGANRAEKRYSQYASPQGFLKHEPKVGAGDWALESENLKLQSDRANLERDQSRENLIVPGMIAGGVGATAAAVGLNAHELHQLRQEALAELQAEQAAQPQATEEQGDDNMKEASEALLARLEKTAEAIEDPEENLDQAHYFNSLQGAPEEQPPSEMYPLMNQGGEVIDERIPYSGAVLGGMDQGSMEDLQNVPQENPRQGAGGISNAPAGVDRTASTLMERLEKTASEKEEKKEKEDEEEKEKKPKEEPEVEEVIEEDKEASEMDELVSRLEKTAGGIGNMIKPVANTVGNFAKNVASNPVVKKVSGLAGAATLGGVTGGAVATAKANQDNQEKVASEAPVTETKSETQEKVAAEATPKDRKSIADKSEKEWIDFMHKVEKEDGVKAEEKPENQSKTASEEDDMLNGLFKEAASVIMDMHFPEIRQHVDPMSRITF